MCPLCEDLAFLLATGCTHPDAIEARLRMPMRSIERHIAGDRHDRPDLLGRIAREHHNGRRAA